MYSHALRGRGSRNIRRAAKKNYIAVTPCEGVGVEIYNGRIQYH